MIELVRTAAAEVPGVLGVDKSYARKTGLRYHVDLHIEVDPAMTVAASHVIAGQVRSRVRAKLGWVADVLVHVEPATTPTPDDASGPSPGLRQIVSGRREDGQGVSTS
jgi:divalent metal cation (Fe/Co/Zn/Cd) transporter